LARTHDLLLARDWRAVALANVVLSELSIYMGRINAEGPDIDLKPNGAQSIAMILHELATNSAKYGALSAPAGEIDLNWSLQGHQQPTFTLIWRESGGPAVTPPTRKGFGATVLEDSIPGGSARISYRSEGIVYRLEAPVAAIADLSSEPADERPRKIMVAEGGPTPITADDAGS
jgi:two-component sensor histidine kinase